MDKRLADTALLLLLSYTNTIAVAHCILSLLQPLYHRSSESAGQLPAGVQEALKLLLEMRRKGVNPTERTVNTLLDGVVSCTPPRMQEAEAVRKLMDTWQLTPTAVTYSTLMKGYGRAGCLTEAKGVFLSLLQDPSVCCDVVALNSFLDAAVRNSDLQLAISALATVTQRLTGPRVKGAQTVSFENANRGSSSGSSSSGTDSDSSSSELQQQQQQQQDFQRNRRLVDNHNNSGSGSSTSSSSGDASRTTDDDLILQLLQQLKLYPNQVSYSTVMLGLARSSNVFSGRKAMALYYEMRALEIEPDELMVDCLLRACCNAHVRRGGLNQDDGKRILADLELLKWDAAVIAAKADMLRAVVPALSEVWKERDSSSSSSSARSNAKKTASAKIFDKYGWNTMDSGFSIL
jgi:pentatricopeptide repeat protein